MAAWKASSDRVRLRPRAIRSQPLLWRRLAASGVVVCRSHPPSGKSRAQWGVAAIPPRDLLPGISSELQCQCLRRHRLMRLITAQSFAGPPTARAGCRWQRRLAGTPDHRGGQDACHVGQPKFADPSTQFAVVAIGRIHQRHARRHAIRQGVAHLLQCDLGLGLEANVIRNTGDLPAGRVSAHSFGRYSGRQQAGFPDGSLLTD